MFWAKAITLIVSLIMFFVARSMYEDSYSGPTKLSNTMAALAAILGIIFCILMAISHWNIMIIFKVALYICACLYVLFKEEFELCEVFWGGILIALVIFIITGVIYLGHLEETKDPDVTTTTCDLLCAKDGSITSGNFSGTIIYMHGSSSEKSMYKYYYQQDDGGIKFGSIPAEDTTIYFITDGQKPYLETIVTTTYFINHNNNPATRCLEKSNVTYKLYVPENSITNVYEFDAE